MVYCISSQHMVTEQSEKGISVPFALLIQSKILKVFQRRLISTKQEQQQQHHFMPFISFHDKFISNLFPYFEIIIF